MGQSRRYIPYFYGCDFRDCLPRASVPFRKNLNYLNYCVRAKKGFLHYEYIIEHGWLGLEGMPDEMLAIIKEEGDLGD